MSLLPTTLLDRYLLRQWVRIFVLSALGFPLVSALLELTDSLYKLLERDIGPAGIALSSLYGIPEAVFLMMPAAALFATVFTIGPFSRHSELTAAKASGRSFQRTIFPLLLASALAGIAAYGIGEISTRATTRKLELREERQDRGVLQRFNFVFQADSGWTYIVRSLSIEERRMNGVVLEWTSRRSEVPTLTVLADSATWVDSTGWTLWHGATHRIPATGTPISTQFERLFLPVLDETPEELLLEPRQPEEMAHAELGRYIEMLQRSGNDTKKLEVKQALKIALPAACFVIALFAAPLAVTSARSGPAVGVAIALGTTVAYLLLINLSQAFGTFGLVRPGVAAWLPNALFLTIGLGVFFRART